jgi:hypothetical protein
MSNVVELPMPDRFENEADIEDIVTLTDLLCVMMAQPDADTALVGMQRDHLRTRSRSPRASIRGRAMKRRRRSHRKRNRQPPTAHARRLRR